MVKLYEKTKLKVHLIKNLINLKAFIYSIPSSIRIVCFCIFVSFGWFVVSSYSIYNSNHIDSTLLLWMQNRIIVFATSLLPLSYYKIMSNKNIIFQILRIVFRIGRDCIFEYVCTESYHSYPCVLLLRPDVILIFFFDTIHVNCVRLSVWSL